MRQRMMRFCLLVGLAAGLVLVGSCRRPSEKRGDDITAIAEPVVTPGWVTFKPEAKVNPKTLFTDHAAVFHLTAGNQMLLRSEETDPDGMTHFRYRQFFEDVEVEHAEFLVRARDNIAVSANGRLAYDFRPQTTAPQLSEEQAWHVAQARIPTERYLREDDFAADLLGQAPDAATGYRPKGKLLFTEDPAGTGGERRLSWVFKVYVTPLDNSRQIYINAADGSVVKELPLFPSCFLGSGPVTLRGTRSFNTQRRGDRFFLVDDCDGNLLTAVLLNAENKRADISDDDNNWAGNNPSVATSYWGLRTTYDYFRLIHHRPSYDGKNGNMTIFNDPAMRDAGHNATGGSGSIRVGLAAAGNDNDDYNTLDIVGHEYTHSVIEQSAGLAYDATKESAALNESFCDIFGQTVEQWVEGETAKEWVIGDDKGCAPPYRCRDLQNPKRYNHPDTYKDASWQTTDIDPHINGAVQNRWYALVCDGGTGTNTELGSAYNVAGIGMSKARRIAYRTLTRYLHPDSGYGDARAGSISAAADLFGADSREAETVTNAWCAVGLCPYVIPQQADKFDRPGGNPNPASPNNNNSHAGATPLGTGIRGFGTGSYPWTLGAKPRLRVADLSIYPANDVDYFNISFPDVSERGGRCFSPGFAFNFGSKVNVRVIVNGAVSRTFVNTSYFSLLPEDSAESFVLEVTAPFPGQILSYSLNVAFHLRFHSDCFRTGLPRVWDEIQDCPMCDLKILSPLDYITLEEGYRLPEQVAPRDYYFRWNGEGELVVPINVLQGNNLRAELVNEAGQTVTTAARQGTNDMVLKAAQLGPGAYSLRFTGYGNGTEILVRTPR